MAKYLTKYNVLINQIDLHQVINDDEFIEQATKWTISQVTNVFAQSFNDVDIQISDLKAFLQFPFSHLDHLESKQHNSQMSTIVNNLMNGELEDVDPSKQIFISKMKEQFLEQMIQIYSKLNDNQDAQMCVFAFICEVTHLALDESASDSITAKLNDFFIPCIKKIARPTCYSEEIQTAYIDLIFGLLNKSIPFLKSTAGSDFVITIAIVPTLSKHDK